MLRTRVIPTLLLHGESLVKTRQFGKFQYIGDPCNTVRIFNEIEVDELAFLDIVASRHNRAPNLELLQNIATECFMPLSYGGGIKTFAHARDVFTIGFEKVILNSHALENPALVSEIARTYGSQAVIVAIDVRKSWLGQESVCGYGGRRKWRRDPAAHAKAIQNAGAGEILLTSINQEGTWRGFDLELIERVTSAVSLPVIAHGGAGKIADITRAVKAGASAVALGSMVVFQKQGMGVLVNFPSQATLREAIP